MLFSEEKSPALIADANQWKQISNIADIKEYCNQVLSSDSGKKMIQEYKSGKIKVLFAIAGEINKKSNNRLNMKKVMELLKKELLK